MRTAGNEMICTSFMLPEGLVRRLDTVAFGRSSPDRRISRSDVIREFVSDGLAKFEGEAV